MLKELRETHISLKIIKKADLITKDVSLLDSITNECDELISIFVATTKTIGK